MWNWINSLFFVLCIASIASGQVDEDVTMRSLSDRALLTNVSRLPADQSPMGVYLDDLPPATDLPTQAIDFAQLMRPTFDLAAEWQAESSDVEIVSYDARVTVPTYPIFGPPPPFINAGFSYSDLNAPDALDLPSDLYDYSLGFAWMRPINDRWMLRFMFSTALATDGENIGSDAWQFRGGAFAMYRPNPQWTWIVGALALGRNDIPVVPAVGAIWQPNPTLRFDLTFPKPKVAFLLRDNGPRQQWGYLGGGFSGGTWAYQQSAGIDDQLTYRDWRIVIGWESTPTPEPGMPFTRGRKLGFEVGYVFAREFEFETARPDISLDDTLILRASASF